MYRPSFPVRALFCSSICRDDQLLDIDGHCSVTLWMCTLCSSLCVYGTVSYSTTELDVGLCSSTQPKPAHSLNFIHTPSLTPSETVYEMCAA